MTSAGQLRHRIQIQRATEVNTDGSIVRTWATLATRWGSIEPMVGQELYRAQQVQALAQYKVSMRYYAGLKPSDRLRDVTVTDGLGSIPDDELTVNQTFNIEFIDNPSLRGRDHILMCSELID